MPLFVTVVDHGFEVTPHQPFLSPFHPHLECISVLVRYSRRLLLGSTRIMSLNQEDTRSVGGVPWYESSRTSIALGISGHHIERLRDRSQKVDCMNVRQRLPAAVGASEVTKMLSVSGTIWWQPGLKHSLHTSTFWCVVMSPRGIYTSSCKYMFIWGTFAALDKSFQH